MTVITTDPIFFLILLFAVAFLYSAVGYSGLIGYQKFVGGFTGDGFGSKKFNNLVLKRIPTMVLLLAGKKRLMA